ncbi:LysR family transcriptional regulator [Zobellella aerophila]|uniref:LysR substrate-binding domain-containing protein n=1 Tax=Zobellella aerophila TaxID=870480 RepID=A0ABP6VJ72_9GAMM
MKCEFGSQKEASQLPSLTALRCFEAAARAESFSRAADELHLTHGAISRAVRQLEDDLGVALFERRNRGVFLTDAGHKLFRAVGDGLGLIRQASRELRDKAQSRPLVVSCEPTLLMRWLIPRWPAFQALHPGLDVHLVAGGGLFSFDSGIDLAIRRNDFDWPANLYACRLFNERIGPVCHPGKVEQFFDMAAAPSLQPRAPRLHTKTRPQAWQEWMTASGQALADRAPDQTFEHFYFSLQAAVAGLGVAIGPYQLVRDDLEAGVLIAPMGFTEDGSGYCLLAEQEPTAGSAHAHLQAWLQSVIP